MDLINKFMPGSRDPRKKLKARSGAEISPLEKVTEARYSKVLNGLENKYLKLGVSETASLSIRLAAIRELTFLPRNRSVIDIEAALDKAAESILGVDLFDMLERKAKINSERKSTAKKIRKIV